MKKNKKLFLASIAAMGAVAIGTGAVSTFAWFTVNGNTTLSEKDQDFTVAKSDLAVGNLYFVADISGASNVDLTDKTGQAWVISNGNMAKATVHSAAYGSLTITPKAYKTRTGASAPYTYSNEASPEEIKAAIANDQTYTLSIVASARARITLVDPDGGFATAFGDLFENTINTYKFKVYKSSGALKLKLGEADDVSTLSVYYSVSGTDDNSTPVEGGTATSHDVNDGTGSTKTQGHVQTSLA